MSKNRNARRAMGRQMLDANSVIADLMIEFTDYLSADKRPTDEEVRATYKALDRKWKGFCRSHELMNIDDLFQQNVRVLWSRHQKAQQ